MYSFKAILQKQPVAIASALRSVLYVLVLAHVLMFGADLLAGIALTTEIVLSLFVWNAVTPTAKAEEQVAQAYGAGVSQGEWNVASGQTDAAHQG